MEEAVGELTAWVSSGPNWPYALVWLHKDTCQAPLLKQGHLGNLPQRGAEMTACGRSPPTPCLWPTGHLPNRVEWT